MLGPLASVIPRLVETPPEHTIRVLKEPTLGKVIPDLLVGIWRADQPPAAYARCTWIDASVRALLERVGPLCQDQLTQRLNLSEKSARTALDRLCSAGIVFQQDDSFEIHIGAATRCVEIVSFEAKLTAWRHAIQQAESYRQFSNRAYVVLDGNRVAQTEAVFEAARNAQVGLLFQHRRIVRLVLEAPRRDPGLSAIRMVTLTKLATSRGGRAFRHFAT
jgi:hypothetical protein